MEFKKYQHLERLGTTEVEGIENGECFVFPKIDGTNASIWFDDGKIQAGSRKRHLTLESDNAGFFAWVQNQQNLIDYLQAYPNRRLFGEWLVPHALKTYRDEAWRRFYVFDVCEDIDDDFRHIPYEEYAPGLDGRGIDYIVPICKIKNPSFDKLNSLLEKNTFLIQDGKGIGEGIVIKNYDFVNKYGRQTWAKIVTTSFKEKHTKAHGTPELKDRQAIEQTIVDEFVTKALCQKVLAKIQNDGGFTSRQIPQLLNTVFYDLVKEETWEFVKKNKFPTIDFKKLKALTFVKVKDHLPQAF